MNHVTSRVFHLLLIIILSIYSSSQYMTLQNYYSHPLLVIYFLPTPPSKLKLRLQMVGTNTNPRVPIKPSNPSTGGVSVWGAFYHIFFVLPASASCAKMLGQSYFLSKAHMFWLFIQLCLAGPHTQQWSCFRKHCTLAYWVGKPTNTLGEGKLV